MPGHIPHASLNFRFCPETLYQVPLLSELTSETVRKNFRFCPGKLPELSVFQTLTY